jgi:quercetin dioxygenase-like cupin family protein
MCINYFCEVNKMENKWKDIREMIDYSNGGITSKVIEKDNIGDVTLFNMSKETEISEHTSTKAGYIYVVEGDGIFNLEGEEIHMKSGVMIFMAANAKHSLSARENTTFVLILINETKS